MHVAFLAVKLSFAIVSGAGSLVERSTRREDFEINCEITINEDETTYLDL